MLLRIISGGAPGVDTGALFGAARANFPTGGFMPKGFKRDEDVAYPSLDGITLATQYRMTEHWDDGHKRKDWANVETCDAVVGFLLSHDPLQPLQPLTGGGTTRTLRYALGEGYELIPFPSPSPTDPSCIQEYLPKVEEFTSAFSFEVLGKGPVNIVPVKTKPVLVCWDPHLHPSHLFVGGLYRFIQKHKPHTLMFTGFTEDTFAKHISYETTTSPAPRKSWREITFHRDDGEPPKPPLLFKYEYSRENVAPPTAQQAAVSDAGLRSLAAWAVEDSDSDSETTSSSDETGSDSDEIDSNGALQTTGVHSFNFDLHGESKEEPMPPLRITGIISEIVQKALIAYCKSSDD